MKFLAVLALALPFVNTQFVPATLFAAQNTNGCGEGRVANSQKICIEPQYIQGCELYDTATTCKTCSIGYTPLKGRCSWNNQYQGDYKKITGCLSATGSYCNNCANGFRRIKGYCVLGVKNCANYNEDGTCQTCKTDYSLVMEECRHNLILGCKVESEAHSCKECYLPYKLKDGVCDIENCKVFNDYGCTACECGFYLTKERKCQKMTDGCLRYLRGKCVNCMSHYKLKGGDCDIEGCLEYEGNSCKVCDQKYEKVGNGCHFKNCYDWLDDQCIICQNGYHLQNGACQKQDPLQLVCK